MEIPTFEGIMSVVATPFAKDGVLYVLSRNRLFALQEGASSKP